MQLVRPAHLTKRQASDASNMRVPQHAWTDPQSIHIHTFCPAPSCSPVSETPPGLAGKFASTCHFVQLNWPCAQRAGAVLSPQHSYKYMHHCHILLHMLQHLSIHLQHWHRYVQPCPATGQPRPPPSLRPPCHGVSPTRCCNGAKLRHPRCKHPNSDSTLSASWPLCPCFPGGAAAADLRLPQAHFAMRLQSQHCP